MTSPHEPEGNEHAVDSQELDAETREFDAADDSSAPTSPSESKHPRVKKAHADDFDALVFGASTEKKAQALPSEFDSMFEELPDDSPDVEGAGPAPAPEALAGSKRKRSRKPFVFALAAVAIVALATVGVIYAQDREAEEPPTAPTPTPTVEQDEVNYTPKNPVADGYKDAPEVKPGALTASVTSGVLAVDNGVELKLPGKASSAQNQCVVNKPTDLCLAARGETSTTSYDVYLLKDAAHSKLFQNPTKFASLALANSPVSGILTTTDSSGAPLTMLVIVDKSSTGFMVLVEGETDASVFEELASGFALN